MSLSRGEFRTSGNNSRSARLIKCKIIHQNSQSEKNFCFVCILLLAQEFDEVLCK